MRRKHISKEKNLNQQNYLDYVTIIKEKFLDLLNNLPFFQERGRGDSLVDTIGGDCYVDPINLVFIVPTFDTKVTEYLCSGWVFFLQTSFDFLTSHF